MSETVIVLNNHLQDVFISILQLKRSVAVGGRATYMHAPCPHITVHAHHPKLSFSEIINQAYVQTPPANEQRMCIFASLATTQINKKRLTLQKDLDFMNIILQKTFSYLVISCSILVAYYDQNTTGKVHNNFLNNIMKPVYWV